MGDRDDKGAFACRSSGYGGHGRDGDLECTGASRRQGRLYGGFCGRSVEVGAGCGY